MMTEQKFTMQVLTGAGLLKIQLLADYLDLMPADILKNAWENGADAGDVVKDAEECYRTVVH